MNVEVMAVGKIRKLQTFLNRLEEKAIRDCKKKEENRRMVVHKGWDWTNETSDSWLRISEEFLPVALQWKEKFHSILDIGAGKGRHAFFFAENGFAVSAVDLSDSSIEWIKRTAEESHTAVDARVCDMTQLPYEDAAFDCVVCFHTIYHTDYMGMKKAAAEIERVLKKNGEAYITFNSKDNVKFNIQRSTDGFTMIPTEGKEAGIPHCYVDENDIKQLLGRFRIVSLSKIQNYVRKERDVTGIHFFVHCIKK